MERNRFCKKTQTSFSGIVPGELAKKKCIGWDKEKLVMGLISRGVASFDISKLPISLKKLKLRSRDDFG